jgi:hypothetical protein
MQSQRRQSSLRPKPTNSEHLFVFSFFSFYTLRICARSQQSLVEAAVRAVHVQCIQFCNKRWIRTACVAVLCACSVQSLCKMLQRESVLNCNEHKHKCKRIPAHASQVRMRSATSLRAARCSLSNKSGKAQRPAVQALGPAHHGSRTPVHSSALLCLLSIRKHSQAQSVLTLKFASHFFLKRKEELDHAFVVRNSIYAINSCQRHTSALRARAHEPFAIC